MRSSLLACGKQSFGSFVAETVGDDSRIFNLLNRFVQSLNIFLAAGKKGCVSIHAADPDADGDPKFLEICKQAACFVVRRKAIFVRNARWVGEECPWAVARSPIFVGIDEQVELDGIAVHNALLETL